MMRIAWTALGVTMLAGIGAASLPDHPSITRRPHASDPISLRPLRPDTVPVVISGVVHPRGAGGAQDGPDAPWILRFSLESWRDADGVMRSTELAVSRRVTDAELTGWMERIRPREVVALRVRFTGPGAAELIDVVERAGAPDEALARRAAELSAPVTRRHPRFGTLTFDRALSWYEAKATWEGTPVALYLEAEDDAALERALAAAERLWSDQRGWGERIRAYAVRELLPVKNDGWLDDGEAPLTPERFTARMTLTSVTVSPDGDFDFMHDDGDLFWGHTIQVIGSLDAGPTDADIPG